MCMKNREVRLFAPIDSLPYPNLSPPRPLRAQEEGERRIHAIANRGVATTVQEMDAFMFLGGHQGLFEFTHRPPYEPSEAGAAG
jgi:hypothetical protein